MTRIALTILLLLGSGSVLSQAPSYGLTVLRSYGLPQGLPIERCEAVDSAAMAYFRTVNSYSPLYYGTEYEGYPRTTNHPYLIDDQYTKARLSYQHVVYPEVLLRLDLNRNELIVLSPGFRNIVLHSGYVDFAELYGKHIIYFQKDSLSGCPPSGYYILLYSGNHTLLEKRNAQLWKNANSNILERYFVLKTHYYLYKDGAYYAIKNKRGLLKVLHPYKKELKRFISSHRLNFREDAAESLILTVNEYEQLSGK